MRSMGRCGAEKYITFGYNDINHHFMFRRKALIAAQGKAMVSPAYRKDIL